MNPLPLPEPGMEGVVDDSFLGLIFEQKGKPIATKDLKIELYTKPANEYQKLSYPDHQFPDGYARSPYGEHIYIYFPPQNLYQTGMKSTLYISINGGEKNLLEMHFNPRSQKKQSVMLNDENIWQEAQPQLEPIHLQLEADGTLVYKRE